jgi:hypothetical protein
MLGLGNKAATRACTCVRMLVTHHMMRRASAADDVDDPHAEPVDALTMGRMMALVAQQGGDLDVALEQVCVWVCGCGGWGGKGEEGELCWGHCCWLEYGRMPWLRASS